MSEVLCDIKAVFEADHDVKLAAERAGKDTSELWELMLPQFELYTAMLARHSVGKLLLASVDLVMSGAVAFTGREMTEFVRMLTSVAIPALSGVNVLSDSEERVEHDNVVVMTWDGSRPPFSGNAVANGNGNSHV